MIEDKSQEISCSNCKTRVTPLWRRSNDGSYLCNACGLYYKIHKSNRPHELKTESFRHRQRTRRSTSPMEYCDRSVSSERECVYESEKRYRREDDNFYDTENRECVYDSEKRYKREKECLFDKENRECVYDGEKRYKREEACLFDNDNREGTYDNQKKYRKEEEKHFYENREGTYDNQKKYRKEEEKHFYENREGNYDNQKKYRKEEEERNFTDTNLYFSRSKKSDRFFDKNFCDSKDFTGKKNDTVKKQNNEHLIESPLINPAIQKSMNPSLTLGNKKHNSNEYKYKSSNYSDDQDIHTEYPTKEYKDFNKEFTKEYTKEYIKDYSKDYSKGYLNDYTSKDYITPLDVSHTSLPLRISTTENITDDSYQYDRGLKRQCIDVIDRFTKINKGESVKYMKGGSKDYMNCGDENTFYGDNDWNKKEWNGKFSRRDMKRDEYIGEFSSRDRNKEDYISDWKRDDNKREDYISDWKRDDNKREDYISDWKREDIQKDELERKNTKNNKFIGSVSRVEFEKSTACINDLYKRVNYDKEIEYLDVLNNEKSFSEEKEENEKYFDELEYLAASVLISFMKNK
ncbi:GATA zinc finger domain-containing protein [Hamiltosporidium magnivora]|uniref:GATA zinc finger domain-containing protein n=1 Tax=Hamiltosporidium magnivora TaxID=148818 RepID=A0A4Q9L2D2_9MICR|nr:GATA zinc finger domain-containing protein [Hamiltosporidium magnivora]